MIDAYFTQLEQMLQTFPNIRSYTLKKKVYNIKQGYIHGSIMFESGCRLDFVEVKQTDRQAKIKYRYHYMDTNQQLVFRYDIGQICTQYLIFSSFQVCIMSKHVPILPILEAFLKL